MTEINDFFECEPYGLPQKEKESILTDQLKQLTLYHSKNCQEYGNYLNSIEYCEDSVVGINNIPFFPVRMFKELDLLSVPKKDIIKTITSSGTTGQKVSRMYIDRQTAALQQKIAVKQFTDFWGKKRLPFLMVDSEETVRNRNKFSARAAGIMGFRFFATEMFFLLDKDMKLDVNVLESFLNKYGDSRFIVFGYTFMVWQHLYKALCESDYKVNMSNAILVTGGGWKTFEKEGVSRDEFKDKVFRACGIKNFIDHYGMSEQTGSVYLECPYGNYHTSVFSDVITRRHHDFSACEIGEKGMIQVVSMAPRSYPGHSLLTEDEGVILGVDDCPCGRKGKYVKIHGRIKNAELRGCSDTYASRFE